MRPSSTTSRCIRACVHDCRHEPQPTSASIDALGLVHEVVVEEDSKLLYDEECGNSSKASTQHLDDCASYHIFPQSNRSRWTRQRQISAIRWALCGTGWRHNRAEESIKCKRCRKSRQPLRIILKCLAIALMLLGLVEFVLLIVGLIESYFPSEFDTYSVWQSPRPSDPTSHWPTDYTADVQPVQCHSHNDYWRPIPLRNAVEAGCTGVEADVWLLPDRATDDLLVGHSRASLTQQRTFRSLYIEPLVEILDKQNPNTTYHSTLDQPRNGVFDTNPEQNLVLLVDFKTDGGMLWPMVTEQLEPLRRRQYLTHFNGTDLVSGPITVVVTGNAPFDEVVKNSHYRDMFFDAPLDLLASLAPDSDDISRDSGTALPSWTRFDDVEERNYLASLPTADKSSKKSSNQGQGRSGVAPENPTIYTPANSYYASVAFTKAVGFPHPFLSWKQKQRIRQQIQGAHKQGLKVRYWDTPAWPRGLKEYVWTVLVEEGVDYLNVDDLQEATRGDWGRPRHRKWGLLDWGMWSR